MSDNMGISAFFSLLIITFIANTVALSERLKYYETLHSADINHAVKKRSINSDKEMRFSALGRSFHLHLKKHNDILSKDFKVVRVDKHSHQEEVPFHQDLYHGWIDGEEDTWVQAYLEDENESGQTNLMATIKTYNDTYVVEPSWRHLSPSANHSMIVYRASDLDLEKSLGHHFCGYISPNESEIPSEESSGQSSGRVPREAKAPTIPPHNTCPLLVVADYRFFRYMGQNNFYKTTSYLISLIDRVNNIYRNTVWGNGFTRMGFAVKEIRVHDNFSPAGRSSYYYNVDKDWDTKALLEALSQDVGNQLFCLVHLFTYMRFLDGSLGLSYVASSAKSRQGGICSSGYSNLYLNTGWSTSVNRFNRPLLTQEAELVTTHELGHNWGSEHDSKTAECSPSSFHGGKYIMYTYAVSGHDRNNRNFSACSRRTVGKVLASKAHRCFTGELASYCGNSNVEENEECDPGLQMNDICCNSECKLKPGAVCSDVNSLCCHKCQFTTASTVCRIAEELGCTAETNCTGYSADCPAPKKKDNGEKCVGRGECRNGECVSFCEKEGLQSCACDTVEDSCKWCCITLDSSNNATCMPHLDPKDGIINLPQGMPCIQGYCDNDGQCKRIVENLTTRLWSIIEQLGPNKIVAFMKANIVGTVITLSLFLWIPVSCIVCKIDRDSKRKEKELLDWHTPTNHHVILPKDVPRVRQASVTHKRSPQFYPT